MLDDALLPETPPAVVPPLPTLGRTNRLYLLLMLLLVGISLLAALLPGLAWVVTVLGDPLLLLVVLWAAAREGRPLPVALRLRWPGLRALGLGLLLGVGAYAISALVQLLTTLIFHQTQGVDIRRFMSSPVLLGGFLIAAVFLAPLTEEVIFRGYFLGIYERYLGRSRGLWLVALLFAALHLQLIGLFSLLPVSILLTYMALRSDSLLPGMAAHLSFNFIGIVLALAGFNLPALAAGGLICSLLIVGPAIGGWALRAFQRMPSPAPAALPLALAPGTWLGRYWPLLLAAVLFMVLGGLEMALNQQRAGG